MRPKTKNWMLKFGLVMFRHKSTWLDQEKIMCWLKTPAYVAAKCPDVCLKHLVLISQSGMLTFTERIALL